MLKKFLIKKSVIPRLYRCFLFISFSLLVFISCGKRKVSDLSPRDIISSPIIVGDLDWKEITTLDINDSMRVNGKAVGDVSIPKIGSRCTGFMITADVLMTNHHCIPTSAYAVGVKVAFRHEKNVEKEDWEVFDCDDFIGNNRKLDFALLRCQGSPGDEFGTLELSYVEVELNHSIYVLQQNCDYYSERNCDWSKKYSLGHITKVASELTHNADTLGGSSGSPVLSATSHKVIGLHHAGLGNNGMGRGIENYAVPMSKIVPFLQENYPDLNIRVSGSNNSIGNMEPNDTFLSAYELSILPIDFSEEIKTSSDKDYFKFTLSDRNTVKILIKFKHREGDLDLKLYSSSKKLLASSSGTSDQESIEESLDQGEYVIKVYGYSSATGKYTMSVTGQGLFIDEEPNNTLETATKVTLPFTGNEREIASATDKDYYKIVLSQEKTVDIDLDFTHQEGDLDLFLLNGQGQVVKSSRGVTNHESISYRLSSGVYYVLVDGYKNATGKYDINVR